MSTQGTDIQPKARIQISLEVFTGHAIYPVTLCVHPFKKNDIPSSNGEAKGRRGQKAGDILQATRKIVRIPI